LLVNLSEPKLFSVDMPGCDCDCGAPAETQYVIALNSKEAKKLAKEAAKARINGQSVPDVCCGECVAAKIASKGFFVSEKLKQNSIKWERVTHDTVCLDCGKQLSFGSWAHFHADSGQAICGDCGVNRGWSDKTLAKLRVQFAEVKQDIISVRKRYKIEVEGLHLLEQKVDLHLVTENYRAIELEITKMLSKLDSYFNTCVTSQEKAILQGLKDELPKLQDTLLAIKTEFDTRLFLMDRAERKHRIIEKVFEEAAAEIEEEQRHAQQSMSEVAQQ